MICRRSLPDKPAAGDAVQFGNDEPKDLPKSVVARPIHQPKQSWK